MIRNLKTGRVLKNPEKYIEKLQQRVKFFINQKEFWRKRYGKVIIRWNERTHTTSLSNGIDLIEINVGDVIANIGKVTSVKASKCDGGNEESSFEYTLLQTRKMPRDFI